MRKRTSNALTFALTDEGIVGFNFLRKSAFSGNGALLDKLVEQQEWQSPEQAKLVNDNLCAELGALVEENTREYDLEKEFIEKWEWGLPAALFHFSVQGNDVLSLDKGEDIQLSKLERGGLPKLHQENDNYDFVLKLDRNSLDTELLSKMERRRSNRHASNKAINLRNLNRVLYSGMGITGYTRNIACELPLSMTPSGGARNPFEAYVFAKNVEGLDKGIYHYSATEHSLGKLPNDFPEIYSKIVGEQYWAENMSCIIILAAHFERTMWKYDDPNAYRVILMEAGHIGQNMLLAATDENLASCPTAVLNHELLFDNLDLPSRIMCAPIYAIALGSPN